MMRPRRLLMLSLVSTLIACVDEQSTPSPPQSPSPMPSLAEPALTAVTSTRTIGDPVPTPAESLEPSPTQAAAPTCAEWMGRPRCLLGDHVLASAHVRGINDANLARTAASTRARAATLGGGSGKLNGSEILRVEACRGSTWALARARVADVAGDKLPACDPAAFGDLIP